MRNRLVTAALAAALLTLTACSGGAQGLDPSTAPTAMSADDTLRGFAPDGLAMGVAVAGGGHHDAQEVPDPFTTDTDYQHALATEFSILTPENQLKWEFVHPEQDTYDFGPADAIVAFAEKNHQQVRGHTLLWHSQNPLWLETGLFTPDQMRQMLHDHIATVVGHFKGKIAYWDVANEIFDDNGSLRSEDNIWIRVLGPDIIEDAFRWAHEADPDAILFLNDYNIEAEGTKSDAYYHFAQHLLSDGIPLGGIGFQGHLSTEYPAPAMKDNLQRFADLGLKVAITEADVRVPTPEGGQPSADDIRKQADYYSGMLNACLAVNGCVSFTVWGIPDKYSWVPAFFSGWGAATPLWDDYSRKPAYCAMQEDLAKASGRTSDAAFTSRGCGT